jgi:hypothetical protein
MSKVHPTFLQTGPYHLPQACPTTNTSAATTGADVKSFPYPFPPPFELTHSQDHRTRECMAARAGALVPHPSFMRMSQPTRTDLRAQFCTPQPACCDLVHA